MNCGDFLDRMDEYRDGSLAEWPEATAHLRTCKSCQQRLTHAQALRTALREMPVAEPRRDFFERALVHAQAPSLVRRSRWTYVATALAASLALWIAASWVIGPFRTTDDKLDAVTIRLHEPRTVHLAFDAERELEQATLSIQLPDGVEVAGFPGQREIVWQTNLVRGVNVLPLPLVATKPAGGRLFARLEHGDRAKEVTLPVRIGTNDQKRHELQTERDA